MYVGAMSMLPFSASPGTFPNILYLIFLIIVTIVFVILSSKIGNSEKLKQIAQKIEKWTESMAERRPGIPKAFREAIFSDMRDDDKDILILGDRARGIEKNIRHFLKRRMKGKAERYKIRPSSTPKDCYGKFDIIIINKRYPPNRDLNDLLTDIEDKLKPGSRLFILVSSSFSESIPNKEWLVSPRYSEKICWEHGLDAFTKRYDYIGRSFLFISATSR